MNNSPTSIELKSDTTTTTTKVPVHDVVFTCCVLVLVVGLFYSRALISVATWGLFVNAILNKNIKQNLHSFFTNKALVSLSSVFLMVLLSGFFSSNFEQWWGYVKINISMLLLPIGFAPYQQLIKRRMYYFLYFYLSVSLFSVFLVMVAYLSNFELSNKLYFQGKTLQTPVIHVRYALMISLAVFCGIYLLIKQFYLRFKIEKYLQLISVGLLICFLHILAVRTGLLSLYCGLLFTVFYFIFRYQQKKLGILLLCFMLLAPMVAYQTLPSIQNKVSYIMYDWQQLTKENPDYYPSDYIRVHSIMNGLRLVQKNPFFGVGIGDIQHEMNLMFQKHQPNMPHEHRFPPINQLVFVASSYGLVGLLFFLIAIIQPLWFNQNYKDYFFLCFYLVLFSSFVGETPLNLQIGQSLFLFFVLMGVLGLCK